MSEKEIKKVTVEKKDDARRQTRRGPRRNAKGSPSREETSDSPSSTKSSQRTRRARAPSSRKSTNREDTRLDELDDISKLIECVPEITLINSTNKAKIYKAQINNEQYKITIPTLKKSPLQLQSFPGKPFNMDVIRNFNAKVRAMDKSVKFYFNYLVNDYRHLQLPANDFKLYENSKNKPQLQVV